MAKNLIIKQKQLKTDFAYIVFSLELNFNYKSGKAS